MNKHRKIIPIIFNRFVAGLHFFILEMEIIGGMNLVGQKMSYQLYFNHKIDLSAF